MKKSIYLKRAFAVLLSVLLLAGTVGTGIAVKAASANETAIYNFMKTEMGLNTAAACGVLANIYRESEFDPHCYGDGGTSYGICQWHASRFTSLKSFCERNGYDYTTITGQLYYLKYELENKFSSLNKRLHSVSNTADGAYEAGYYWCYIFEVPANYKNVSVARGNFAVSTYWPVYSAMQETTTVPVTEPTTVSTGSEVYGSTSGNSAGTTATTQIFTRFIDMLRTIIGALQYMIT